MQKIGDIPNTRADSNGEFTDGNVAGGVPPTILPAKWFNTIQRELISILSAAGITPDSNKFDQVSKAVSKLITDGGFLKTVNNLSEIKTAGAAAVAATLANLGISGNLIPVGIPLPWPAATPPDGWLKCNGSVFDKNQLPQLALVYPSGRLPDLRGEFIRGWDDGRGVDTGRALGSAQASTGLRTAALDYHGIDATTSGATVGTAFNQPDSLANTQPGDAKTPDNGVLGDGLNDNSIQATQLQAGIQSGSVWITTRPRNVAFNYIVRAV